MVVPALVFLLVAAVSRLAHAVEESACETSTKHVKLECRIVSREWDCYTYPEQDIYVNRCGRHACVAWTGVQLKISCRASESDGDGDSRLILSRGDSVWNSSTEWFTVSSSVQGNYECRWSNGSLLANRTIDVDGEWTWVSVRGLYT